MTSNIFILSRPIRSGKTTELSGWVKGKDAAGILTPDVDGKRVLVNIATNEILDFEVDMGDNRETIVIGKFHFLGEAFDKAKSIIHDAPTDNSEWLIVDEVGKLEVLQDKGFEPTLTEVISAFKAVKDKRLLLVVRDSLLQDAINKYGLQDAIVVNDLKSLA